MHTSKTTKRKKNKKGSPPKFIGNNLYQGQNKAMTNMTNDNLSNGLSNTQMAQINNQAQSMKLLNNMHSTNGPPSFMKNQINIVAKKRPPAMPIKNWEQIGID